jgi:hypothetical protein
VITVTVEAGFGSTMLTASPTWTDISPWLRTGHTDRGRASVDQRFEVGTGTLMLDNRDARFDPFNTTGPYSVKIGVPVRITALLDGDPTVHPIFYGSVRAWRPSYPQGNTDSATGVTLADGFYTLNQEDLAGFSYPAQRTDQRIAAVLDSIGWPAGLRDLATGVATVQATSFAQPGDGGEQPALQHLLDVAESEAGALFMGPDGKVVFQNRVAQSGAVSAATYDGQDDYSNLDPKPDDAVLYNVIRIAREDGAQVEYDGSGGAARRVLTRDVMPMGNDGEVLNVAEWLYTLFGEQRRRIDGIRFKPRKSVTLLAEMVSFDLRDVITLQHDPPGAGDTLNALCAIEHIHHEFPPEDWTTVWSVVPLTTTETQAYWILGTSTLGTTTRLA